MSGHSITPAWIAGDGLDSDIVISTRARLARSLAAFPFPARATGEDLTMIVREVRAASTGLTERFPRLRAVKVDSLDKERKSFLLDAHVASVEQISGGVGRIILFEPTATLSIMVNEEDHIRMQTLFSGFAPEAAWEMVNWADDVLAQRLEYGFSDKYGYLTASVSNVGTGLRVSTMMHLAGLALSGRLKRHLRAAYDLGVSIRGVYGEGTRWLGDLFQVSNEITLGLSERDITGRVRSVAEFLLKEEQLARNELLCENRNRLIDQANQSINKLRHTRAMSAPMAIALLSPIRLAASLKIIEECPIRLLNEMLIGMRAGEADEGQANIDRADFLRVKMSEGHENIS